MKKRKETLKEEVLASLLGAQHYGDDITTSGPLSKNGSGGTTYLPSLFKSSQ